MDAAPAGLTDAEAAALAAVLARLIPSDEHGPGAVEAQVPRFIARALAGELGQLRERWARNLSTLDTWARAEHGASFAGLAAATQDAMLTELERGLATGFDPSSEEFFELVRLHAIQGMFSDPRHGGNAGHTGWELIGFPGAKATFTAADQQLDRAVTPIWRDAG